LGKTLPHKRRSNFRLASAPRRLREHVLVGDEEGFFDEFGLDVEPVLLRGSSIAMQARPSIR
jgi:hypothetical protein